MGSNCAAQQPEHQSDVSRWGSLTLVGIHNPAIGKVAQLLLHHHVFATLNLKARKRGHFFVKSWFPRVCSPPVRRVGKRFCVVASHSGEPRAAQASVHFFIFLAKGWGPFPMPFLDPNLGFRDSKTGSVFGARFWLQIRPAVLFLIEKATPDTKTWSKN